MTYLITWSCYGCHLHGAPDGSVDPKHDTPGTPLAKPDPRLVAIETRRMTQPPFTMNEHCRRIVLAAMIERCSANGWCLIAAHIRTNHVHLVVESDRSPERVMNDLKSFASRKLNQAGLDEPDRKRWARHGSTRQLFERNSVLAAVEYVVDKQGVRMSVYEQNPFSAVTAQKNLQ